MTTVTESTGTVNFDQTVTDTRALWRAAVAEVAEKATAALPQCQGRIDKAVSLVLAGAVDLLADGTARVASQSNGQTIYHIVNGHCDCRDYEHAPESWCKHRLAHAIAKRAYTQAKAKVDTGAGGQATAQPAPVAPALPPGGTTHRSAEPARRLVPKARHPDAAEHEGRPLLVVPLDPRRLVQG